MAKHELKIWPGRFAAVLSGVKRYEVRKHDRDFRTGDTVVLREWEPDSSMPDGGEYTGRSVTRQIGYMTEGSTACGIQLGWVVFSLIEPESVHRAFDAAFPNDFVDFLDGCILVVSRLFTGTFEERAAVLRKRVPVAPLGRYVLVHPEEVRAGNLNIGRGAIDAGRNQGNE